MRRCIRFGSLGRPLSACGEVEHECLFGGNGALRELDDFFCAVLLLLLPDVLGGGIVFSTLLVAEACRKASVAFIMSSPFQTLLLMSPSFPLTQTVS